MYMKGLNAITRKTRQKVLYHPISVELQFFSKQNNPTISANIFRGDVFHLLIQWDILLLLLKDNP